MYYLSDGDKIVKIQTLCLLVIFNIEIYTTMKTKIITSKKSYPRAQQLSKHREGFDKNILLEILMLTEEDFSSPMSGVELIEALKKEGLL